MNNIKYSKEITIDSKVIRKIDVLQFAQLIKDLFQEGDYLKKFSIFFDDKSSISGQDMDVFECFEFERRKSILIILEYESVRLEKRLKICLRASMQYTSSEIEIISNDNDWYHQTLSKVKSIIEEIEPQNKIAIVNKPMFEIAITVGFGVILGLLAFIGILNILHFYNLSIPDDLRVFTSVALTLCFYGLINQIIKSIQKAYPSVQFDFGPDFKNKSNKLKKMWGWLISVVIIPIILFMIGIIIR